MTTSSSPHPEESMKALMDAVAQVQSLPTSHYGYPQPVTSSALLFHEASNGIAPAAIKMGGHSTIHPAATGPPPNRDMLAGRGGPLRKRNHGSMLDCDDVAIAAKKARADTKVKRLEQNRLAAIESRRRKKHMVEELQRSVQFYTKANSSLKNQNADLERQLLIAKQKLLMNKPNEVNVKGGEDAPASAKSSLPSPSKTKITSLKAPSNTAVKASSKPSKQPTKPHPAESHSSSSFLPAMFGNATSSEMEKSAQQAQFAATQALYKTMGYPAGAARVAASTFSQFVGQTGIVPGLNDTNNKASPTKGEVGTAIGIAHAAISQAKPSPVTSSPLVLESNSSPKVESEGSTSYIEALNRFAMHQAAAANAAAAAATAAMQAAHLHKQLNNSASTPGAQAMPSFPFVFPAAGMAWPFLPQAPFAKKD